MTVTIWHNPPTRSIRVFWLLTELGVPFEVKKCNPRDPEDQPTLPHPFNKLPALKDGDVVMWESGAIIQYLLETYGKGLLAPAVGSTKRPEFLKWCWFIEASLNSNVSSLGQQVKYLPEDQRDEKTKKRGVEVMGQHLDFVEETLASKPCSDYIVGDTLTAADIMLTQVGHVVKVVLEMPQDISRRPYLSAYMEAMWQQPGFQRACAKP